MGYFDGPDEVESTKKGFFDRLGEMAGKTYAKQRSIYEKTVKESMQRSDEALLRSYRNESNVVRKQAIANELKNRGYNVNDL